MIEYLNYRALDTSSDNYGSNLGAVLMEYTNQDFGRDYVKWMDWYKAEGETFDLENNLKSRENYLSAVRALRKNETQEALDRFEQALKDNPGYRKVLTEYASLLNTLAWQKVTSPQTHADLAEGLKLARRCVELDPQAMYIDTLAEACYQNGLVEEAIEHQKKAVELEPETEEYQSRLEMLLRRSANHL